MTRIVVTNVTLLDGEHPAKPDMTIAVEGDRIVSVSNDRLQPESGDRVIDGEGRVVMPGMVQGHFHSTYLNQTGRLIPPLGFEYPPAYQAYIAERNAYTALEHGFTSVVSANASWDVDPSLASAIGDGLVTGPRVIPCSREIITTADSNDQTPWYWDMHTMGGARICDGADEFRKGAREEIKRGAELIKLFPTGGHGIRHSGDTSVVTFEELKAAVDAAHSLGKRARAHVASKRGIMMCLEAGMDILDHADGLDHEAIAACAELGTIIVPSITMMAVIVDSRGGPDSPIGQSLRSMCEILPAAVEAGVTICLGDDYGGEPLPHGQYGIEFEVYVNMAKIAPLEVLRWATVNGAKLVGLPDLGRIVEGARADLIVVNGDPTENVGIFKDPKNVKLVMWDGQIRIDRLGPAESLEH